MTQNRHRNFCYLSGSREQSYNKLKQLFPTDATTQSLWVGDNAQLAIPSIQASKAKTLLGQEFDIVIYDAWDGLHPEGFAAISGTVKGGGYFILIIPNDWPSFDDPVLEKLIPQHRDKSWHLLSRLQQHLFDKKYQATPLNYIQLKIQDRHSFVLNIEQKAAISAIQKVVTGHRKRPLVLVADRGRGKTTALALAAIDLLKQGHEIILTAPRYSAVALVFQHLQTLLPEAQHKQKLVILGAACLRFNSTDDIIQHTPQTDLLLVDEAAAIPVSILSQLLHHYSRLVFSTTVHGYEGSGQGFDIRFKKELESHTPQYKRLILKQPVRWMEDDPFEQFVWDSMLLGGRANKTSTIDPIADLQIIHISQYDLLNNEALLTQTFTLLVNAHYQTSPIDLAILLDASSVSFWLVTQDGEVIAVLQSIDEGEFDTELSQAVSQGSRRISGHLLPQYMALQSGMIELCKLKWRRIIRVAVAPDYRRQGIARQLINACQNHAELNNIDFVGSSFAMTEDVLQLWTSQQFTPIQIGYSKDTASGCHSVLVSKALSSQSQVIQQQLKQRFQQQLPSWTRTFLNDLHVEIVKHIYQSLDYQIKLTETDQKDLYDFCHFQRPRLAILATLEKLTLHIITHPDQFPMLASHHLSLLAKIALQNQSIEKTIADTEQISGKKILDKELRLAVQTAINDLI